MLNVNMPLIKKLDESNDEYYKDRPSRRTSKGLTSFKKNSTSSEGPIKVYQLETVKKSRNFGTHTLPEESETD